MKTLIFLLKIALIIRIIQQVIFLYLKCFGQQVGGLLLLLSEDGLDGSKIYIQKISFFTVITFLNTSTDRVQSVAFQNLRFKLKISRHIWCYVLNHHVWIRVSFKSRWTTILGLFKRGTADWMMNKTIKAAIMLNCTYITDGDRVRQRNWWGGTNAVCKFVCVNLSVKRLCLSSESLINSMSRWLTACPGKAPSDWLVSLFKEQSYVFFFKTKWLYCFFVVP